MSDVDCLVGLGTRIVWLRPEPDLQQDHRKWPDRP